MHILRHVKVEIIDFLSAHKSPGIEHVETGQFEDLLLQKIVVILRITKTFGSNIDSI